MAHLTREADIRAAGEQAVAGWEVTDEQVEAITALLGPVADLAYGPMGEQAPVLAEEMAA